MKILHILDHSLPLHSGYTFRSQNIFRAQAQMGYHPIILTSFKHEESLKKTTPAVEHINGFIYYRTGQLSASSLPIVSELRLMYRLYRRILEVAAIEKPAVIHAHSPLLNGIPALWAGRKLNIPVVYEIRAFWEDAAVDHGSYAENSWKYRLTRFLETRVCARAKHVCILCNGLKQDLINRGIPERKVTVVFNGVNIQELKPVPPDEEFFEAWGVKDKIVVGFVGSFYRYEGLDLLVKSFAGIARRHENAMLLLVGGGEMENELKAQAENLKIGTRLIMPGRIPHERIAGVYALIDILAYPRYSMRLTELVTPLKPLEAMAMEKNFIASDVGGHRELVRDGETGLLFRAGNLNDLEKTMEKLLGDSELRNSLGQNGKK